MNKIGFTERYETLQNIKAEIKDLEKQKAALEAELFQAIPEDTEKYGYIHAVTAGKSISYAKALQDITPLIQKTKQPLVEEILANHTSWYKKHSFKLA